MQKRNTFRCLTVAFLVLFVFSVFSPAVSAYTYNGRDARRYANQHALNPNPDYREFSGDCANFVSQCLYAGGIPQDKTWFYKTGYIAGIGYSEAWASANGLKNYLKNNLGATRLVSKWTKEGGRGSYAYINNSSNLIGEGNEIIFYDWIDDGYIDHASICVGTGYPQEGENFYGDLIDQHTTNRLQVIWHLDDFNSDRYYTAIYAFAV